MDQLVAFAEQNLILSTAWVVLFALLIFSFISPLLAKYKRVNNHEATMLINKKDAMVLDIRPQTEFRAGHIQGATQLKPEQVRQGEFSKLENKKNAPIVVVCAMGNQATGTASKMVKQGFDDVYVLDGGMSSWTSAGLPLSK
ncbi:MAG: rhodanese-like domain-containing protein [Pseudomonadota bacterium]